MMVEGLGVAAGRCVDALSAFGGCPIAIQVISDGQNDFCRARKHGVDDGGMTTSDLKV